jgi:MoaA/NifB/PqqE/SkfB family radical SAM enzyme
MKIHITNNNDLWLKFKNHIGINKGNKIDTSNSVVRNFLKYKKKDRLCFAPSKNIFFGIDGTISSCYAQSFVLTYGKYPETKIKDAWKSSTATKIRSHMKNSYLLPACNLCYTQVLENNFDITYAGVYDRHSSNLEFPISMEFYLSNICNLECIMCSPENSSLIAKKNGLNQTQSPYSDSFTNELKHYIPHLKQTYFFGGEPFLIPIYYVIWDQIIELNPECAIDITTNGTVLNSKVKATLEKAKFNINISLDSLQKEHFEKIRKNANFDIVIENLNYFHNYCKSNNTNFFISFCPLQQNWKEIPHILEFANKLEVGLIYNRVWKPSSSAIWTMPHEKLKEITNYLNKFEYIPNSNIQNFNIKGYNSLKKQITTWHKSSVDLNASYTIANNQQIANLVYDELKLCYIINRKSNLSKIKNQKQLDKRNKDIIYIIEKFEFNDNEKFIFLRNLIMQKSYFINSLFFADDINKITKIINLAKE